MVGGRDEVEREVKKRRGTTLKGKSAHPNCTSIFTYTKCCSTIWVGLKTNNVLCGSIPKYLAREPWNKANRQWHTRLALTVMCKIRGVVTHKS